MFVLINKPMPTGSLTVKNHVVFPYLATVPSAAGYLLGTWSFRKAIRIPAHTVTTDLDGFTILVDLTEPGLAGNPTFAFAMNMDEVGFSEVYPLAFEIQSHDSITGHLVAWVRLPRVLAALPTDFWLYWGTSGTASPTGAWSDWQLSLLGGSVGTTVLDYGSYDRNGSLISGFPNPSGSGPNRGLIPFHCGTGYVSIPGCPVARRGVVSFWFKHGTLGSAVTAWEQSTSNSGTFSIVFNAAGFLEITAIDVNGTCKADVADGVYADSTWHLLIVSVDDQVGIRVYIDGTLVGSSPTGVVSRCQPGGVIALGAKNDGTARYPGQLAGIRSGWFYVSANWVLADYLSQTNSLLNWYGGVEIVPTVTTSVISYQPVPYRVQEDLTDLTASWDHNAYLFSKNLAIARLDIPPATLCAIGGVLDGACWQSSLGFDAHSGWFPASPNLAKYQDIKNYAQPLGIVGNVAVRVWCCLSATGEYPTCDPTPASLVQNLGMADAGVAGYYHSQSFGDFILRDWAGPPDSTGFLATYPDCP